MAEFLNFKGDYKGLSTDKAEKNLSMYGENLFTDTGMRRLGVKETLFSPVFLLLIAAALIYAIALDNYGSAVACLVLAVADIAVKIPLCRYCNRRLYGRMLASEMKYRVIREERLELVAARSLVPDDIIILQAGEIVPADAHILECTGLAADESMLSGKPGQTEKHPGTDTAGKGLKASCLYAGSRIISGSAVSRIFATGEDTARVRRAGIEKRQDDNFTEYERAAQKIYVPAIVIGLFLSAVCLVIRLLVGGDTVSMPLLCLSAIGQMMCFIPAAAGIFIRLYCVVGLKRIERKGAAIKSLKDIEKLNGLTALVIDKSTVVSPNLLEVAGIYSKNDALMTTVTALACAKPGVLPTEQAFLLNVQLAGTDIKKIRESEPAASFPYNENDKIGGNIYRIDDKYLLCVQGSVEKVTGLCSMQPDSFYKVQQRAAVLAKRGLEVWASAYAIYDLEDELPKSLYAASYKFIGLTAYMSATRDIIPLAVQGCRRSGVKPILVSSDSAETAVAMGKKLGISPEGMITGEMLREAELSGERPDFAKAQIFSNITLAQKPAIIDGLRDAGETVACIGFDDAQYDTVIRSDLGITSLDSTTGSLYEACGLVMSDDSFGGIVEVFKEARQLHRNIKKLLSVFIVTLVTAVVVACADMLFGVGVVSPMFAALISAVIMPVCAVCYIDNTAEMRVEMRPSNFLGHRSANKGFFVSKILSGAVIGVVGAAFMLICSGLMTAGQTAAATLILISSALSCYTLFISSSRTGLFALMKSGAVNVNRVLACAFALVLIILLGAFGIVNWALGLESPGIVVDITAIVLGVACSGWHELKKFF
ncbi:MAG: cation-transporting P-type ATPase [Eubacterium sp.]|nr:cation-transporting P-type ATPase [Eubacterium sp.]